ncbi:hypothetical protein Tco_0724313 [Tanacetum coccineum]
MAHLELLEELTLSAVSTLLRDQLTVAFQREVLEEERWGQCCVDVSSKEIQLQEMEKLEWFRSMLVESYTRLRLKRYIIGERFSSFETGRKAKNLEVNPDGNWSKKDNDMIDERFIG